MEDNEIIKIFVYDNLQNKKIISSMRLKILNLDNIIKKYKDNYIEIYKYGTYIGNVNKSLKNILKGDLPKMNENELVIIRGYGDYDPSICTFYRRVQGKNALQTIEEYLNQQTKFDISTYIFQVRNEDDSKHLYSYYKGKITNK